MANVRNRVTLIGNLGKDPEVRTFDTGKKKATFSLATNESFRNQAGEKVQETQWHNLVVWGHLADIVGKYLRKGAEVAIEGKLVHRSYEAANGERRYITEINVNDLVMLAKR